jgi:hypothetical protein
MKWAVIFVAVTVVSNFPGFAQSRVPQKTFRLGFVTRTVEDDGEWVWLATTPKKERTVGKTILILGYGGYGMINVDGRNIRLKQVEKKTSADEFKVGKGGREFWIGEGISVRLDYVYTWLCPPADENCEVYHYKGMLAIKYKGISRKVGIVGMGGS